MVWHPLLLSVPKTVPFQIPRRYYRIAHLKKSPQQTELCLTELQRNHGSKAFLCNAHRNAFLNEPHLKNKVTDGQNDAEKSDSGTKVDVQLVLVFFGIHDDRSHELQVSI